MLKYKIELEGLWKGELTSMTDLLCMEMCMISKIVKRKPEKFWMRSWNHRNYMNSPKFVWLKLSGIGNNG
jgi:hypothetical protein